MANKMLIDASHPEETRVVVVRSNRIEDFDYESAARKQLRGNIYLAKVTRVEPSLQAAFVDYGGNRHGFLAFSEIHPDYYQIPVADRQALIEAEEQAARDEERAETERRGRRRSPKRRTAEETVSSAPVDETAETETLSPDAADQAELVADAVADAAESDEPHPEAAEDSEPAGEAATEAEAGAEDDDHHDGEVEEEEVVESVGGGDALEELPERRKQRVRQYKIQEVIRRRQVLLVQVVKEERGNKGAALTTYLSLAGRYSVLMPNTARGGGISRKITNAVDRKRLKEVATELEVPEGMGVILRTAGASRTKAEVRRDFEYLLRLWESVRELTLRSTAPTLVYEEGSLIKRSIRDLYTKDIDEILVAGDEGYREAKDFMRMLMPSHAKNVQPYKEVQPIFGRYGIEAQLDAMFSPQVSLPSGGYLVMNQTEALVSIDVNSGRSTREHNIEDTAHQTNLQAADEIARQLRLRDLAGLIVIDFIDMEERRNNRSVERRLKDALRNDRARIQVGRISHFGLMEMSRQRIRTGVLESTSEVCPHCAGTGQVRSAASVALHVLRSIEDHLLKGVTHDLIVRTRTAVALYVLNQKRAHLSDLERRFGLSISVMADETVSTAAHFVLERGEPVGTRLPASASIRPTSVIPTELPADEDVVDELEDAEVVEDEEIADGERASEHADGGEGERRGRRRRRRRRGGEGRGNGEVRVAAPAMTSPEEGAETADDAEGDEGEDDAEGVAEEAEGAAENGDHPRRRRRGRRGGRRSRRGAEAAALPERPAATEIPSHEDIAQEIEAVLDEVVPDRAPTQPAFRPDPAAEAEPAIPAVSHSEAEAIVEERPAEPPPPAPAPQAEDPAKPRRGGWWQRRGFF
ncbi:MAG: ribonuclease E/G [Bauldia sp.]|nr:ribonuclease E/G [Bauldia sp.]